MTTVASLLATSVQYLKGVGPHRAEALAGAGIVTIADILEYVPRAYIERTAQHSLRTISRQLAMPALFSTERENVTILRTEVSILATVTRLSEHRFRSQRTLLKALINDSEGSSATLLFWNAHEYYRHILQVGKQYIITGVPELDQYRQLSFTHPHIQPIADEDRTMLEHGILPVYRITENMQRCGISIGFLRRLIRSALEKAREAIVDPLPEALRLRYNLPPRIEALEYIHFPKNDEQLRRARHRFKFEEIFLFELLLATLRQHHHRGRAPVIPSHSPRWDQLLRQLPFHLTPAQERAIRELVADLASGHPMHRLLQGDVGSGKTLVALAAMLHTVDSGYQALLAVPTEVLAQQHWSTLKRLTESFNVEIVKLVGGQSSSVRQEIASHIARGEANIIVGTHALFAETASGKEPRYHRVGLIVIDEQHRFGVVQRAMLRQLGINSHSDGNEPHLLVMSATPIPRTLTMTLYGDLDVSLLDQIPPGRQPVRTEVLGEHELGDAYQYIRQQVRNGHQAFIVYPLVEESTKLQLKDATSQFELLKHHHFPTQRLKLLHGQMSWSMKEDIMQQFAAREFDILVATTVIEVGIDVPNATAILIHHAERFGLAQLHQLRGRVGRGDHPAVCFLVTQPHIAAQVWRQPTPDDSPSVVRLRTMEQTTNGFLIAEVDMKLRGPGDMLGTRQSGIPEFRYIDLVDDSELIENTKNEAFALVEADPHLRHSEHVLLRKYVEEHLREYSTFTSA